MSVKGEKYKSKKAKMKHEKSEGKKERMMEYGKKGGMSDILDGKLARDRNQITELGKLLDPIADKAMLATATIISSSLGLLSWWITVIFLTREVLVTVLRFAVLKKGVIPASRGGKLKTFFQNFGVGFYILPLPTYLNLPRDIFMSIAILLTITTGIDYFKRAFAK